ncbi:hypothetical protein [Ruminococcus flavefaciens]|uniref:hypothetical protein n=1 Tax=Ruminococcus flavefaciens TaxID=1265 RepID=UPI0002FEDB4F|nr:hypothetical protein [Ruminococcus flavefaciens]
MNNFTIDSSGICSKTHVLSEMPMMKLAPLFPKKAMLNFVYDQQVAGSAKKK